MAPIVTFNTFPAKSSSCIWSAESPECSITNASKPKGGNALVLPSPNLRPRQSWRRSAHIDPIRSNSHKHSYQTKEIKNETYDTSMTVAGKVMAIVLGSFFLIFLGFLAYVLISRCKRPRSSRSRRNTSTVRKRRAPQPPNLFTRPLNIIGRPAPFPSVGVDDTSREGIAEGPIGDQAAQLPPLRFSNPFGSIADATYADRDVVGRLKAVSLSDPVSNLPLGSPAIRKLSFQSQGSFDLSGFTMLNQYPFNQEGSGESSPGGGIGVFPLSACPSDSFRTGKA